LWTRFHAHALGRVRWWFGAPGRSPWHGAARATMLRPAITKFRLGLTQPIEQIISMLLGHCTCGHIKGKALQLLAERFFAIRPTIILFGDSFTQRAFLPGQWGARLAAWHDRTADVIMRGYSGYNSRWLLEVAPTVFRSPLAPALVIVQMGTNDSVRSAPLRGRAPLASRQHISVEEYEQNLTKIVQLIRTVGDGSACVLLMTPAPIDDAKRQHFEDAGPRQDQLWTNECVQQYVAACVRVGKQVGAPVVNLYEGFFEASPAQWCRGMSGGTAQFVDGVGEEALFGTDGMHPCALGGQVIFQLISAAITDHFPHLQPVNCHAWAQASPPDRLPLDFPDHKMIDPNDVASSMARHSAANKRRHHGGAIELLLDECATEVVTDAKGQREPSPPQEPDGLPALPTAEHPIADGTHVGTPHKAICQPVLDESLPEAGASAADGPSPPSPATTSPSVREVSVLLGEGSLPVRRVFPLPGVAAGVTALPPPSSFTDDDAHDDLTMV